MVITDKTSDRDVFLIGKIMRDEANFGRKMIKSIAALAICNSLLLDSLISPAIGWLITVAWLLLVGDYIPGLSDYSPKFFIEPRSDIRKYEFLYTFEIYINYMYKVALVEFNIIMFLMIYAFFSLCSFFSK